MRSEYHQIELDEEDLNDECSIFKDGGQFSTDYFEGKLSKKGVPSLVYGRGAAFLLLPKACEFHKQIESHSGDMALISAGILNVPGVKQRICAQVDFAPDGGGTVLSLNIPNLTIKNLSFDVYLRGIFDFHLLREGKEGERYDCCFQYVLSLPHELGLTSESAARLKEIVRIRSSEATDESKH